MDGVVDRREWTLQHRKAADISLTPPQAELDSDGLDVNVKGPGERDDHLSILASLIIHAPFTNDFFTLQMASLH